jgi:hypothetical protein
MRRAWEDNMNIVGLSYEDVNWMKLASDRTQLQAVLMVVRVV